MASNYDYILVLNLTCYSILQTSTFQCVLVTTPTESFVILLYAYGEIQQGNAVAGINAGDGVNSITLPGSLTSRSVNITQISNVGIPGVWIYKVGEGT